VPEVALSPFVAGPKPRPTLGPAFSVFAVLLWSFVVAGQFTTSWMSGGPLPPSIAFGFVVIASFVSWFTSVRLSAMARPARAASIVMRAIGIGVLALLLFVFAVFAATVAGGASSHNHDLLIAFALVIVSAFAGMFGPRWTWPSRPERTPRQRSTHMLLWIAGTIVTLVAALELLVSG
jgi:hypothetical protein